MTTSFKLRHLLSRTVMTCEKASPLKFSKEELEREGVSHKEQRRIAH